MVRHLKIFMPHLVITQKVINYRKAINEHLKLNIFLITKKTDSAFYKSIHISYPDKQDRKKAKEKGGSPGRAIMIHGQKNGFGWLYFISRYFNWTDGCIAVSNMAMDDIWDAVDVGIPIEIKP